MRGDDTFDRLRNLEVDSFEGESNLSREMDDENLQNMYAGGRKQTGKPFMMDTMSEIGDEKEKNAIFNHSLRHGVVNDIRNSPLKDKMPNDLQYYDPALEKRLFAKEMKNMPGHSRGDEPQIMTREQLAAGSNNVRFKEFKPRGDDAENN